VFDDARAYALGRPEYRGCFASDDHGKKLVKLGEGDRLTFAQQILGGLFVVSLLVIGGYAFNPDNKAWAEIFELIKVGPLPLVTLVIGFYFPSSNR
jgi:hypothetical protein